MEKKTVQQKFVFAEDCDDCRNILLKAKQRKKLLAELIDKSKSDISLMPFIGIVAIMMLGFAGLAYSFYPYIVPEKMTIVDAASAPESLLIILFGTAFVLPVIIGYSIFAYRVFGGKATELRYD